MADKKKKIKVTQTMGCIPYNIDQFNKRYGTSNDNNNPTPQMIKTDAEFVAAANNNNYGWVLGNDAATGNSGETAAASNGGEGGGLAENKMHVAKNGYEKPINIPNDIEILPKFIVDRFIKSLKPLEEFKVGYVTVLFSTEKFKRDSDKKDYVTILKCTKFTGCTGIDFRDAEVDDTGIVKSAEIDKRAADQTADPKGETDYGIAYNKENNKVKSNKDFYRRNYGEINKTVAQKYNAVIDDATGDEVNTRMDTILFYQLPDSFPESIYYVCFEADSTNYLKIEKKEDLLPLIQKQYPDNSKMAKKIEKLLQNRYIVQSTIDHSYDSNDTAAGIDGKEKPAVRALYTNQIYYLASNTQEYGDDLTESLNESKLTEETKRYVKRYYIRPQNIVCSNKEEILKALIEIGDENCSVYSLKSLSDHDDVHLLTNKDIIYYYDDGVLYDKNHVKVMDYELGPKHEEERKKFNQEGDNISTKDLETEYNDRLTMASVKNDDVIKMSGDKPVAENLELQEASHDLDYYKRLLELSDRKTIVSDARWILDKLIEEINNGLSGVDLLNRKKQLIDNTIASYKNVADEDMNRYAGRYLTLKIDDYIKNKPEYVTIGVALAKAGGARRASNPGGAKGKASRAAAAAIAKTSKDILKDWLQEHTINMVFSFPCWTGESTIGGPANISDEKLDNIINGWEGEFSAFSKIVKNATESGDYVFRNTDSDSNTAYDFWHRSARVTFDTEIKNAPQEVQNFIQALKYSSGSTNDLKSWDEVLISKSVDSYPVAWGILELFDFDISFYKIKNINSGNYDFEDTDTIGDAFDQTFESYNAYGQRLVEGKATVDTCCICGREIDGYGNNPEPYKSAENGERCCDPCNVKFVIPARLAQMYAAKNNKEGKDEE